MQMDTFAWFFLSLRGRVSRQEFWLGYFGLVVVALLLVHALPHADGAIYFLPGDTPDNEAWRSELLGWPEFISLVLTWPFIAIYAKRLHDLGLSAWWLLLIPVVTFVAGMCELGPSSSRPSAGQHRPQSLRRGSARRLKRPADRRSLSARARKLRTGLNIPLIAHPETVQMPSVCPFPRE